MALNCQVHAESRFDRKHYFYSDLPAGYQITQKYAPLANNGRVKLSFDEGHLPSPEEQVVVEIEQLQLEQDTAKSSYFDTGTTSRFDTAHEIGAEEQDATPKATLHEADDDRVERSFVDLNRAGAGLMEIVSGPQMRTPEQAGAYVRKLQELVRRVGASDGNMQEGSLRCDVNVSVNRIGEPFGTRCEVKNLNSVRFMMNAISYESHRQVKLLEQQGGKGSDAVEYFERVASGRNAQTALNWIIHELMKGLNARNLPFKEWFMPAEYLGQLIDLVEKGQVTGTTAKAVIADLLSSAQSAGKGATESPLSLASLEKMAETPSTPILDLLRQNNLLALATTQDLLPLVESALERLPDEVAQVKKGNVKVAMRIVGQVMKDANGRADAKLVHQTILERLGQASSS
ncbi:hypothetical protein NDA16_004952 [Ustilago loliicola]|nr:hypothetical protein NDA16_004952 [Ustilago loliicola]